MCVQLPAALPRQNKKDSFQRAFDRCSLLPTHNRVFASRIWMWCLSGLQRGRERRNSAKLGGFSKSPGWHCLHGPARTSQHNEAARPENKGERLFQRIPDFVIENIGETSEAEIAWEEPAGFKPASPAQWSPGAWASGIRKEDQEHLASRRLGSFFWSDKGLFYFYLCVSGMDNLLWVMFLDAYLLKQKPPLWPAKCQDQK